MPGQRRDCPHFQGPSDRLASGIIRRTDRQLKFWQRGLTASRHWHRSACQWPCPRKQPALASPWGEHPPEKPSRQSQCSVTSEKRVRRP